MLNIQMLTIPNISCNIQLTFKKKKRQFIISLFNKIHSIRAGIAL